MRLNHYRFRSEWRLSHPLPVVWDALEELEAYPKWWPEIRRSEQIELAASRVTCRSFLPYELVFVTRSARREPSVGVLEATLEGDLNGFSRWTISELEGGGTLAVFDEEVDVGKTLLKVLAPVARPAFRANHWLMMKHGRDGLEKYLAR